MARCANGWFATSPKGRHRCCSFRAAFGLHLLPEYGDNATKCVKNTARHQNISLLAMYYIYIYRYILIICIYTHINYIYINTLLSFISSSTHLDCMWQTSAENMPASPWLMHPRHHRYPQWAFGLYLANTTLVVTWEDLLGRMGTLDDMAVVKTWRGKNSVPKLWTYHQIWIALPWHPDFNAMVRHGTTYENVCHTPDEGTQVWG